MWEGTEFSWVKRRVALNSLAQLKYNVHSIMKLKNRPKLSKKSRIRPIEKQRETAKSRN